MDVSCLLVVVVLLILVQYSSGSTRINGKLMAKNVGKVVTLICTYIGKNERGQAVVKTSDGVDIVAVLPPGESFERY